ncbi:MAG: PHP domain-containing protein [Candidatus Omnitrophica bacterium]|nr:PHP domain-containing protein [Candidatus Omnitrophota bacterium]
MDNVTYKADLHVHTDYSDGTFSPKEVVEHALSRGLDAIAITDHDSVEGMPFVLSSARGSTVEIIPAIEISCLVSDKEMHLLGYFIDWENIVLVGRLANMKKNRFRRAEEMVEMLNKNGVNIKVEDIIAKAKDGVIGRLHVAQALVQHGAVSSVQQAFDKLIGSGKPCYVGHQRLECFDAINMVLLAGGVPVLAHPALDNIDTHIEELVRYGIKGIEVYHSKHSKSNVRKYLEIAKEHSLIATGGSDCHGFKEKKVLMGTVTVGRDTVDALRKESEKIREKNFAAR